MFTETIHLNVAELAAVYGVSPYDVIAELGLSPFATEFTATPERVTEVHTQLANAFA